jgi:hypothetical protein
MPTKVLKGKKFARFAKKAHISDADLWAAVQRANAGLIDADLGGGIIKQRIARTGEGKSSGSRSIILFGEKIVLSLFMGLRKRLLPT